MKTVTICGSMRFERDMQRIAFELETKHGMNVLQCTYNVEGRPLSEDDKAALKKAHFRKIELSDAIYVVNIGGYVGDSAREEMRFARETGKERLLHTEFGV